jgi:alpha-amylase
MHKRMLAVSRAVQTQAAAPGGETDAGLAAARLDLWRAQCNCAYWHGLFGGLYLPHLRSAVYRHLVRAETALERRQPRPRLEWHDVDADGRPEVMLRSEALLAVVKPDEGGAIFELDDRVRAFNLVDLMTRREEAYHDQLRRLAPQAGGEAAGAGGAVSIHDLVAVKEAGLENRLVYDAYRRGAGIDHALGPAADLDAFAAARLPEVAALAGAPYAWRIDAETLHLERRTPLLLDGARDLIVRKRLHLHDRVLEIDWALELEGDGEVDFRFGIEMAASLLAGDAPDRWYEIAESPPDDPRLASRGVSSGVRRLEMVDAWLGVRLRFETDAAVDVWRVPIETVSNSESGFERVYQGSALLFVSRVRLAPGATWRRRLRLEVEGA